MTWNKHSTRQTKSFVKTELLISEISLLGLCVLASASVLTSCGTNKQSKQTQQSANISPEEGMRSLFEEYKKRDLANDPSIMDLYTDDATISLNSKVYSKAEYAQLVQDAYKSPAGAANKATAYSNVEVMATAPGEGEARFSGSLATMKLNVNWMLRRTDNGWRIWNETFGYSAK